MVLFLAFEQLLKYAANFEISMGLFMSANVAVIITGGYESAACGAESAACGAEVIDNPSLVGMHHP